MKCIMLLAVLLSGCVHISQPNDEAHYECYVARYKPPSHVYKMLPCADADAAPTDPDPSHFGTWCQVGVYSGRGRGMYPRAVDCEVWDTAPGTPFIDIRPK